MLTESFDLDSHKMYDLLCENEASFNSFCRNEFKTRFNNIDLSRERESFKSKFSYFWREDSFRVDFFQKEKKVKRDWRLFSEKEIREIFDSNKKPFCDFIDEIKEMRFTTILKSSQI